MPPRERSDWMESNVNESTHVVEQWKPVVGYEGLYSVSASGVVRSEDRVLVDARGIPRRLRSRVLRPARTSAGYQTVVLCANGAQRSRYVHELVLEAFAGPRPIGLVACHGDGKPANNHAENLRWGTYRDNGLDALRHGTNRQALYTHCPRKHLLAAPNLVASKARQGWRDCLVCARTRAAEQKAKRAGHPVDFIAEADARYADLMGSRRAA